MMKVLTVGLTMACLSAACLGFAETKTWDGGGADDNLTTKENWVGDVAPVAGDTLVFSGSVRTTPNNDFPAGTSFEQIQFDATSVGFTLSGNAMTLANQNPVVPVTRATPVVTETVSLNLTFAKTNPTIGMGGQTKGHAITFKGAVAGTGTLGLSEQFGAAVKFEGALSGFAGVRRPNSDAAIWLTNPNNEFTSPTAHVCGQGTLKVDCAAALGSGDGITVTLGQQRYTGATFQMNAASDQTLNADFTAMSPGLAINIQNAVSGTILTLTGDIAAVPYSGSNVLLSFGGNGGGVFAGDLKGEGAKVQKLDACMWTLAGNSSGTNVVDVQNGTLMFDGDWSSHASVAVAASGTIGGTGTVANVTFKSSASVLLSPRATNADGLFVTGSMRMMPGNVTVKADTTTVSAMTPGVAYKVIGWETRSGEGVFSLDPSLLQVLLVERSNALYLVKQSGDSLIWKGNPANNVWDSTTANWIGGGLYADGQTVLFNDAADAGTADVEIGKAVSPTLVKVSGTRNYSFSGEKIGGVARVDKDDASVLVFNNPNDFSGALNLNGGAVVQNGLFDGIILVGATGTAFTNDAAAKLTGESSIRSSGAVSLNNPENDFTGGIRMLTDKGRLDVSTLTALGKGTVDLWSGTKFYVRGPGASQPEATLVPRNTTLDIQVSGVMTWSGDVVLPSESVYGGLIVAPRKSGTTVNFGSAGGETTVKAEGRYGIGHEGQSGNGVHWYSHLQLGANALSQNNGLIVHLHHADNEIGQLVNKEGSTICHATNATGWCSVQLSQQYKEFGFVATLDLNGFDQTVREIDNIPVVEGSKQIIKSDKMCVLTVSNDVDAVTAREQGDVQGLVTIRKAGGGVWTTHEKNSTSGDFVVSQGVLLIAENDVLPCGSSNSRLTIANGAKVAVADGIIATVPRLTLGDKMQLAGVYGGRGCTVAGARILPEYFADGAGAVRVTKGNGGIILIVR